MEDFQLDIVIGKGPSARSIRLDLPRFTLVGATTRTGLITGPLRDRFGFVARLDYYDADRPRRDRGAHGRGILGVPLEADGAAEIARRGPGHAAHRQPAAQARARLRRGARRRARRPPPTARDALDAVRGRRAGPRQGRPGHPHRALRHVRGAAGRPAHPGGGGGRGARDRRRRLRAVPLKRGCSSARPRGRVATAAAFAHLGRCRSDRSRAAGAGPNLFDGALRHGTRADAALPSSPCRFTADRRASVRELHRRSSLIYFAVLALAFFLLIVRPQRRETAGHRQLVATLSVGDEVITSGGIFGTVRTLDADDVDLEVAPGTVIRVARLAIARPIAPNAPRDRRGDRRRRPDGDRAAPGRSRALSRAQERDLSRRVVVIVLGALLATIMLRQHARARASTCRAGSRSCCRQWGNVKADALDVAVDIIRNRVDSLGVAEPEITRQGSDIVVDLPGVKDRCKAERLVGQTAELRFRPVLIAGVPPVRTPATTTTTGAPGATTTTAAPTTTTTTTTTLAPVTTTTTHQPGADHQQRVRRGLGRQHRESSTDTAAKAAIASCDPNAVAALPKIPTTSRADDKRDACVVLPDKPGGQNGRRATTSGPPGLTGKASSARPRRSSSPAAGGR